MNPAIALFLKRWWPALAGALVLVAILSLAYCKGQSAGRSGEVIKQQKREIEVQQDLGRANDKAGAQRLDDAMKSTKQEKELNDALASTNDPDRQRALRGCIILRQQGRDTSNLPACR
jgi:hypothetical protein